MSDSFVNHENTKYRPDGAYGQVISQIAKDGVCPFCPENLRKYHKLPITEKKFWFVTDNMYPYKPAISHRLLIHKAHIAHIDEISSEAWSELREIIQEESTSKHITGGSFLCRFGDTHFTGASVHHLHASLVQSDPEDPTYDKQKGIIVRIG